MPFVLHLVTQRESGGAQVIALSLARHHRQAGVRSEVWFLYRKADAFPDEAEAHDLVPHHPGLLGCPGLILGLWRRLRQERPSAVIAHTHWCAVLVLPIAWLAGVPVRLGVHHSLRGLFPAPARWLDALVGLSGAATGLIGVSQAVTDSFAGLPARYRRLLTTIANGVEPLPAPRGPSGLPRPLAVAVGRLSHEKNQRMLIEALVRLPTLHVAIAGTGPLRDALLAEATTAGVADRLHLLGACDRQRLADLLAGADLFVMPSRFEGLSLALVEAMATGIAVVASDLPANRQVLGEAGVLVPVDDAPALAEALGALLADDARRAALAQAARTRAARFDPAAMGDAYLRLAVPHG